MTKFNYVTQQKGGVNEISFAPYHEARKIRFRVIDGALIIGFMLAFVGLVFLLSK